MILYFTRYLTTLIGPCIVLACKGKQNDKTKSEPNQIKSSGSVWFYKKKKKKLIKIKINFKSFGS